MLKKAALAGFALVLAINFVSAQKAAAQVHVGVGVNIGTPVVVQPAPVVVQPAPIVVGPPPPTVVVYDDAFFVAHTWDSGFHDGWYYERGNRYWIDRYHHRHYDYRFRDGRVAWMRHRHDNGWHGERGPGHDNGWHGERGPGHDNGWHGGHGRGHDGGGWRADGDHGHGHGHGHDD